MRMLSTHSTRDRDPDLVTITTFSAAKSCQTRILINGFIGGAHTVLIKRHAFGIPARPSRCSLTRPSWIEVADLVTIILS